MTKIAEQLPTFLLDLGWFWPKTMSNYLHFCTFLLDLDWFWPKTLSNYPSICLILGWFWHKTTIFVWFDPSWNGAIFFPMGEFLSRMSTDTPSGLSHRDIKRYNTTHRYGQFHFKFPDTQWKIAVPSRFVLSRSTAPATTLLRPIEVAFVLLNENVPFNKNIQFYN